MHFNFKHLALLVLLILSGCIDQGEEFNPVITIEDVSNSSRIINITQDTEIKNSILMGVYVYEGAEVKIKNSLIYRVVTYNGSVWLIYTEVYYLNDRNYQLERILERIIEPGLSNEEKVLRIHRWVNNSIVHEKSPTYGSIQNFNTTLILKYMDGDCGAHSAVMGALAHFAGFPSRFISAKSHFVTEIYFDDGWHMLDSDPRANKGRFYRDPKTGGILSSFELYKNPELYDKDFFHVYQPEYNRYFDIGLKQLSVDGSQRFFTLDKKNEEHVKRTFYDKKWMYLTPRRYYNIKISGS